MSNNSVIKDSNNKFYNVTDAYNEKFFQLLQVFFVSPKYRDMSNDAKVMYALLKDRNLYSIRNRWFDENGNIYFNFTNKKLMDLLNCGKEKLQKVKRELIDRGLLLQKQMGVRKPNRLYLLRPEVSTEDAYEMENWQHEMENQVENYKVEKTPETKIPKSSNKSKINHKDNTTDISGIKNNSTKTKEVEEKDNEEFKDVTNYFGIFDNATQIIIKQISRNSKLTTEEIEKIILSTKKKALYDNGIKIGSVLDIKEFQNFIRVTLRGIIKTMKSTTIKNLKGYIYTSFYNGFGKFARIYNSYVDEYGINELVIAANDDGMEDTLMNYFRNSDLNFD